MQIVLDDKKHGKRKRSNKRLQRFHTLRHRLDAKKAELARLEADMSALLEVYRTRVLPVEAEEIEPLIRLAERLTVFFSRKSLGKRDRDDLAEWFWETEEAIRRFQPERADALMATFEGTIAAIAGLTAEEFKDLMELHEQMAQAFEASMHGSGGPEYSEGAPDQEDLFGFEDIPGGVDPDEIGPDEAFGSSQEEAAGADAEQLMNGAWIRGVFRRTAHALHPDREPDFERREHKHVLMTRLLEARKEEDALTILELYCEHVSGGELQIANDELDSICTLLSARIEALQAQKDRLIYADPLYHMVFELLHGKSRQARERKLNVLIDDIRARAQEIDHLVSALRNLDCLREALRSRRFAALDDVLSGLGHFFDFEEARAKGRSQRRR